MKVAGFDVYLTHGLYGSRPWRHTTAYRAAPRWYFVEAGTWTLEVTIPAWLERLFQRAPQQEEA